jgi:iron complex outermembrane recepter protein
MTSPHVARARPFAFALLTASLTAQTSPAPAPARTSDDTIVLSAFEVTTQEDRGYLAAESTTGTRYAVKPLEVPFSVGVITSEFIEDSFAFDLGRALSFTSSAFPSEGTGAFILRGIRASGSYKNGFRDGAIFGPASIDRVEVIKGNNAAVYGQTDPSGLVNTVTKLPLSRPFAELKTTVGTDSFYRALIDVSQPFVGGRLAARFAASSENSRQGPQDFAGFWRTNLYGALVWKITPNLTLTGRYEYIRFRSATQNAVSLPYVYDTALTAAQLAALPAGDPRKSLHPFITSRALGVLGKDYFPQYRTFNSAGPKPNNTVEFYNVSEQLTWKLGRLLSARALVGAWRRNQLILRTTGAARYFLDTGTQETGRRSEGELADQRVATVQTDVLAQFATGPIDHKVLLTADASMDDIYRYKRNSAVLPPVSPSSPGNYNGGYDATLDFNSLAVFPNLTQFEDGQQNTQGVMATERMAMQLGANVRPILMGGIRRDTVYASRLERLPGASNLVLRNFPQQYKTTYQTGALVKLFEDYAIFGSYAESFLPQSLSATGYPQDNFGRQLPTQTGSGYDLGVKTAALNGRLNLTLNVFGLRKQHISQTATNQGGTNLAANTVTGEIYDPAGVEHPLPPAGVATRSFSTQGDQQSKGVEFDFNLKPRPNFSVFGNYAYVDARWTKSVVLGGGVNQVGLTPNNAAHHTAALGVNYTFTTWFLRDFSVRVAGRYLGRAPISSSVVDGRTPYVVTGTTVTYFDQQQLYNPGYKTIDLGLSYQWKTGRIKNKVSIDSTNLNDERGFSGQKPIQGRQVLFSYGLSM